MFSPGERILLTLDEIQGLVLIQVGCCWLVSLHQLPLIPLIVRHTFYVGRTQGMGNGVFFFLI